MLFSAGTFLYVSLIHVLPEVSQLVGGGHGFRHEPLPTTVPGVANAKSLYSSKKAELIALVVGCLLPVMLAVNHHH
jgi:zinc transporter 9